MSKTSIEFEPNPHNPHMTGAVKVNLRHRPKGTKLGGLKLAIWQDQQLYITGLDKHGNYMNSLQVYFHPADIELVIQALRAVTAGPLGRLAIEAELNQVSQP